MPNLIARTVKAITTFDEIGWSRYAPANLASPPLPTSITGVRLDKDTALSLAAVWAAIRAISEDLASLPLIVYRQSGQEKVRAADHWLYPLVHDAPNPDMSSFVFTETLMGHELTWGNAYAEIVRNGLDQVAELRPMRPDWTRVAWEGARVYYYRNDGGSMETRLTAARVLHIPGFGWDGLVGYSPLRYHRDTFGLTKTANEYGARVFANDSRPDVVISRPGDKPALSDIAVDRLKRQFEANHRGAANAARTSVLQEGMTITTVGFPPEDAQYLETRKFQRNEIATIYRIPPHKIGDLERATFSNIEQQALEYVQDTLRPWAVRWERQIKMQLLADEPDVYVEFLFDALLRTDTLTRFQAYQIGRNIGVLSADDILRSENRPPLPDKQGQTFWVPLNVKEVGPGATPLLEQAEPRVTVREDVPPAEVTAPTEGGGLPKVAVNTGGGGNGAVPPK